MMKIMMIVIEEGDDDDTDDSKDEQGFHRDWLSPEIWVQKIWLTQEMLLTLILGSQKKIFTQKNHLQKK